MSKNIIYALHGFIGQGSDWNRIKKNLQTKSDFIAHDLFAPESNPIEEFEDYIEILSEEIDDQIQDYSKKIFVGYSLGGRLGLHLLQNNPDQFDHYFFLSTNPGFSENESADKNDRLLTDMKWASKLNEKNWSAFLKEWNAQSVFEGSGIEPDRHIKDFDINKLKRALVMWSLSQQDDFRDLIAEFQNKITWVVGDKDKKYLSLSEEMVQKKILLDDKRIFSGHRIWLDQPEEMTKLLSGQLL